MTHLKQHVFNSAGVCVSCGTDLQEADLPCDDPLWSAPDYFDRDDPRWQAEESETRCGQRHLITSGGNMKDGPMSKNTPLRPEEEKAKTAILGECDKLAAASVTFVAVHFDGYGDSGATEDVKCYDSEWYGWEEHASVKYDASHLQERFEALVPFGYENDCGGFGEVVLNVAERKITVERNDRFEDYTTTSYEV